MLPPIRFLINIHIGYQSLWLVRPFGRVISLMVRRVHATQQLTPPILVAIRPGWVSGSPAHHRAPVRELIYCGGRLCGLGCPR